MSLTEPYLTSSGPTRPHLTEASLAGPHQAGPELASPSYLDWEKLEELLADVSWPSFAESYRQAMSKPYPDFSPDWPRALWQNEIGRLVVLVYRLDDRITAAFFVQIDHHLMFRGKKVAWVIAHFVAPWGREGWAGYRIWKTLLKEIKDRGVDLTFVATAPGVSAGAFFRRLGFKSDGQGWMRAM